jgi:AraC-like DNA-binding protein
MRIACRQAEQMLAGNNARPKNAGRKLDCGRWSMATIQQTPAQIALIARAKVYAEHNIGDPELGLQNVAAELGISTRYLQLLFRSEGVTFSEWMWRRRLELCRRSLMDAARKCNIGNIAFDHGFSDFSHFSRRFRAAFGVCPRDFTASALKQHVERTSGSVQQR